MVTVGFRLRCFLLSLNLFLSRLSRPSQLTKLDFGDSKKAKKPKPVSQNHYIN